MANPQYPPPATDRWNLNIPLLIGVVFVFLLGVVVWVLVASGDDDPAMVATTDSTEPTTTVDTTVASTTTTTTPGTTTPAPMPDATAITSTTAAAAPTPTQPPPPPAPAPAPPPPTPTTPPAPPPPPPPTTTTAPTPPTTARGADPGAVPGDLAIPDYPMQAPPCNDSYITVIASAVGDDVAPEGILVYLEDHPGSNYLRTDQTCPSLTQSIDGEPIYVVFFGPFVVADDACAARAKGTDGAYVRQLSEDLGPDHGVPCPE